MESIGRAFWRLGGICRAAFVVAAGVAMVGLRCPAGTEANDGDLRVEVITAYNLVVDSNGQQAPTGAYLGARVHNDGATDLTNVFAYIGDYNDLAPATSTPGVFPSKTFTVPPDVFSGTLSLTFEADTADATRYLGTIPAGEYVTVYWLVSYPQRDELGTLLWGTSTDPSDDLSLDYDIWATATDSTPADLETVVNRSVQFRRELSAAANKILPNGTNKVPDEYLELFSQYMPGWGTQAEDGSPGTKVVARGVWYDLGVVGAGFDNDGDLVPDRNAWMQPVGNPSTFDADAFRLVKTSAMLIVKLKTGGVAVLLGDDQLYFEHIPENNGVVGWVGYEYIVRQQAGEFNISPYQEVASGFDNEKFNVDFGSETEAVTLPQLELDFTKSGPGTVDPAAELTFKITFTNQSDTVSLGHPETHMPLIIHEHIQDGMQYVLGSADDDISLPAGMTVEILYSTTDGASWTTTEPGDPATVTDIQWWLSDPLPPTVSGYVTIRTTPSGTQALLTNTASALVGPGTPLAEATTYTVVNGTYGISGTVFSDSGTNYGDGNLDGDESGIDGVDVSLYYDTNGNRAIDEGDVLIGTTTTATDLTEGAGYYSFGSLGNGDYLVVVDTTAAAVADSAVTTGDTLPATISDANVIDEDFGFAGALGITKVVDDADKTVLEGDQVTYTIEVTNNLPGDGTSTAAVLTYDVWASSIDTRTTGDKNADWDNDTYATGAPDLNWASDPTSSNPDTIGLTSFTLADPGSTLTKVELVLYMKKPAPVDINDTIEINIYHMPTSTTEAIYASGEQDLNTFLPDGFDGRKTIDVTSSRTWLWSDFNASDLSIVVTVNGQDSKDIVYLNAAGFHLTSDELGTGGTVATNLQSVPLTDTYDPSQLEYVGAVPAPTSIDEVTGVISWDNVGPIYPGGTKSILVAFHALEPTTGGVPNTTNANIQNTAAVTGSTFQDGSSANDGSSTETITVTPAGSIGDTIWRHRDGHPDGVDGIQGVTVELWDAAGTTLVASTTTDADGLYLFEGLTATDYIVKVIESTVPGNTVTLYSDPDGGADGQAAVTIDPFSTTGADTDLAFDFGYTIGSLIDGYLWHDTDHGGEAAPETDEPLLDGVLITLYQDTDGSGTFNAGDVVVDTTYTNADGYFAFADTSFSGEYRVTADTTTGDMAGENWAASYVSDPVTVAAGGLDTQHINLSYYLDGSLDISGTLFYDWDGLGTQGTADAGIAGITVSLYGDTNEDGVLTIGTDTFLGTTETTSVGYYEFTSRPEGYYIVVVDENDDQFPVAFNQSSDPDDDAWGTDLDGQGAIHVTVTRTGVDFGYTPVGTGSIGDTVFIDANGDGAQSGSKETGIADITVTLYADLNGDGTYVEVKSTFTDSNGEYLFEDLPDGDYRVEVATADGDLPADSFGDTYHLVGNATEDFAISGGSAELGADFGFAAFAAIGDYIYWDTNSNGTQDTGEPGINGATVWLYEDTNGNGVYDDGGPALDTQTTVDGLYFFKGLEAGNYVVVVDQAGAAIGEAEGTADPDNDGLLPSDPLANGPADNETGVTIALGAVFVGADFGYAPTSAIGDTLWIDLDQDGRRDTDELGIPYVTLTLVGPDGTVTTETDTNGEYSFANLSNGAYTLTVSTGDLPTGLTQTYELDGVLDASVSFTVAAGTVATVAGSAVVGADFKLDFGYVYGGNSRLSGTVGMDGDIKDGILGGTGVYSGVASDESAFPNITVYLYLISDNNSNLVYDTGDTVTLIASTTTDSNGDYSFTGLPTGTGGDTYIVSLASPMDILALTTLDRDDPKTSVVINNNKSGYTVSAYQVVSIPATRADVVVQDVDFAFELTTDYDFGDLPATYSTVIGSVPIPAAHVIVPGGICLGTVEPDADANGQPTADATGDDSNGTDDEDGIVATPYWQEGTDGGEITYTVSNGSGWLVAWIDFDQSGDFTGTGEMIISQAVSTGSVAVTFDIPAGTFSRTGATALNARFRLFVSEPGVPEASFSGVAEGGGEVEDYQWTFGGIGDFVWRDSNTDGIQDAGEPGISGVTVDLYQDAGTSGVLDGSDTLLLTTTTDSAGGYFFAALLGGTYLVDVADADGVLDGRSVTTPPAPATPSETTALTLVQGTVDSTIDFGYSGANLDVTKTITNGTEFTIGDTINYHLEVVVLAGSNVANVQIDDVLPEDLVYVTSSLVVTMNGVGTTETPAASATYDAGTRTLSIPFGTITSASDDTIELDYSATVSNTTANNYGDVKTNAVTVSSDTLPDRTGAVNATIVEPQLTITKTVENVTPCTPPTTEGKLPYHAPEPGDTLEYTITITNALADSSMAYDVTITDELDPTLEYVSGSASISPDIDVSGQILTWGHDQSSPVKIDIAAGGSLVITYRALVRSATAAGDPVGNSARTTWYSQDGASGRDSTDGYTATASTATVTAWDDPATAGTTFIVSGASAEIADDGTTNATNITDGTLTGLDLIELLDGAEVTILGDGVPNHENGDPDPFGTPSVTVDALASATIITDSTASFSIDELDIGAYATLTLEGDIFYDIGSLTMAAGATLIVPANSTVQIRGSASLDGSSGDSNYVRIVSATASGDYTIVFGCTTTADHVKFEEIGDGQIEFDGPTALSYAIFTDGSGVQPYVNYTYSGDYTWDHLAFDDTAGATETIETSVGGGIITVDSYVTNTGWIGGEPTELSLDGGDVVWQNATPCSGFVGALSAPDTGGVLVAWKTDLEDGVACFQIQRREDGKWQTVGTVFPDAVAFRGSSYEYLDYAAKPLVPREYRVVAVDSNGTTHAYELGEGMALYRASAPAEGRSSRTWADEDVPEATVTHPEFDPPTYATDTPVQTGSARKASVPATGLYRAPVAGTLYNVGCELPRLDGDLVFVRGISDIYTERNIVWAGDLTVSGTPGEPPIPSATGELGADGFVGIFRVEQNEAFTVNSSLPPAPNWYYSSGTGALNAGSVCSIKIDIAQPRSGEARIAVGMLAITPGSHDLVVVVGGEAVGRGIWSGAGYHVVEAAFAADLLVDGENTISLYTDAAGSRKRLDYLEIRTPAEPVLRDGSLLVAVAEGTDGSLSVPDAALAVDATTFGDERLFSLGRSGTVAGLAAGDLVYFCAEPGELEWGDEQVLANPVPAGATYVAVAPDSMLATLDPLLQKRAENGHKTAALSLTDAQDVFGGGLFGPAALVRLARATETPNLLLAAGTTYDYKNYEGRNTPVGIPCGFVHVAEGLAASDDLYTNGFATAVGRLPARTATELDAMVRKIVEFDPGNHVVMLSDVDDTGLGLDRFAELQAELADILPSTIVNSTGRTGTAIRSDLVTALRNGAKIVAYQGHGGSNYIGRDDDHVVFSTDHCSQVPPSAWILSTCLTGSYWVNDTSLPILSHRLLTADGYGAVAVFCSTRYGESEVEHEILRQALLRIAAGNATWGDVLLRVKRELAGNETTDVYTLLGDPAMRAAALEDRREVAILAPNAGDLLGAGTATIRIQLLGDGWAAEKLKVYYRRGTAAWTAIDTIQTGLDATVYELEWDPPEDGDDYQIMVQEVAE